MGSFSAVHVISGLHPRSGGPSRTVVQLTDALADVADIAVSILSQGRAGEPAVQSTNEAVSRYVAESSSVTALKAGLPVRNALNRLIHRGAPGIIHSHGLWLPVNHWSALAARHNGIPLISHPRGMLEPWALNHKASKKRLAMAVFQRRDLEMASVLVATSVLEYQSIRKLGLRGPAAIIPNGVELDKFDDCGRQFKTDRNTRNALFLSRVHQKKGLINLIRAWGAVRPDQWRLRIAGPNEGGHLSDVMSEVKRLGLTDVVEYVGEVDGGEKAALYRASDLFIFPTFSENFGVVVAEALAHALPVITTRGAPWADLTKYRCGWWIDVGVEPLTNALRQAIALSDDDRRAMGERGRVYVQRYDWAGIAKQMAKVYRWVLGQEPRPDCVHLD